MDGVGKGGLLVFGVAGIGLLGWVLLKKTASVQPVPGSAVLPPPAPPTPSPLPPTPAGPTTAAIVGTSIVTGAQVAGIIAGAGSAAVPVVAGAIAAPAAVAAIPAAGALGAGVGGSTVAGSVAAGQAATAAAGADSAAGSAMTGSVGMSGMAIGLTVGIGAAVVIGIWVWRSRRNETKGDREDFAESLGFKSDATGTQFDHLFEAMNAIDPVRGGELRHEALNVIGKHDVDANVRWMHKVLQLFGLEQPAGPAQYVPYDQPLDPDEEEKRDDYEVLMEM